MQMVENVANNGVEVLSSNTEDFVQKGFTVEANPVIFSILSQSLYKNPLEAVIRELSSNALDAHVAAGIENTVPIEVNLPTTLTPYIEVIDHGVGMSGDFILNSFSSFGTSTKRDKDSKAIGGFGIGAKSPFAISTSFTITSVHKGKRSSFLCTKDGLAPSILCLEKDVPCEEGSGTTIRIDGLNSSITPRSVENSLSSLLSLFTLYPIQPIINYPSDGTPKSIKLCEGFYAGYIPNGRDTYNYSLGGPQLLLKLGASFIPVPIPNNRGGIKIVLDKLITTLNCRNLFFFLEIDPLIVPVTPSREDYIRTPKAADFIDSSMKRVFKELEEKYSHDGWLPLLNILHSLGPARIPSSAYDVPENLDYAINTSDFTFPEKITDVNVPENFKVTVEGLLPTGGTEPRLLCPLITLKVVQSWRGDKRTQRVVITRTILKKTIQKSLSGRAKSRIGFISVPTHYYIIPKNSVLTNYRTLKVNNESYAIDPKLMVERDRILLNAPHDIITVIEQQCGIEISYPPNLTSNEDKWGYLKKTYPNIQFTFDEVFTEKVVVEKRVRDVREATPCRRYQVESLPCFGPPYFRLEPMKAITKEDFLNFWNSKSVSEPQICVFQGEGEILEDVSRVVTPYIFNLKDTVRHTVWVIRNQKAKGELLEDVGFLQDATRTGRLFIQDIKAHEYSWDKFSQYMFRPAAELKKVFLGDAVLNELQKSDWFSLKLLYTRHLTNRELHFLPELKELTKLIEDNPTIKETFLFHGQTGRGDTWENRWSFPKKLIIELTADVIDYYQCKMEPMIKKAAYLYKDKTELDLPPKDVTYLFKGYSESVELKDRRLTYKD